MKCGLQMIREDGVVFVCELERGHRGDHEETDFREEDEAFVTVNWPNVKPCLGCPDKAGLMRALEQRRETH